jgi:hypothetical protein
MGLLLMIEEYIELALAIVGVASILATLTPTNIDNKVVSMVSKFVHLIAMNFGSAANKEK